MRTDIIAKTHNECVDILNDAELTQVEAVTVLAQLLIYTGKALTEKEIDLQKMNLIELEKVYYTDNEENDMGLGLILNGASIMGAIDINEGNEIAKQENDNDN